MKKAALLPLLIFTLLTSCGSKDQGDKAVAGEKEVDSFFNNNNPNESNAQAEEGNAEIIGHEMIDGKKKLMGMMPMPANWRFGKSQGEPSIYGPGGINIYTFPSRSYMFSNDPMMQQSYSQNGGKIRPYTQIEGILQQDLMPVAKQEGSTFIRMIDAPGIAAIDRSITDMLYRVGAPMEQKYTAAISEWKDKNGNMYAIIIHLSGTNMGNAVMWNYNCHALEAPKEKYEQAKKQLVYAMENTRYNPGYFNDYNQLERNRADASMAQHYARMQAQQSQFDAQQATFKSKNDAINSSIASNYANSDAASDRNHNRFMNYIKDENTVRNPNDGNRYQVQTGSNQYYMNDNGQYIPTNDPNYNPNRDPNTNGETWNEVDIEN